MRYAEISRTFAWVNLTPEPGHFTFGYYDRIPWDEAGRLHLALRIPQQVHLPLPDEVADVGYVDRVTRTFTRVGETRAWCHQQGAMTLWLRRRTLVYNDFLREGDRWRPIARIYSLDEGAVGHYEVPLYAVSHGGRWGVTLNFSRIPRRGYSYALTPLPRDDPAPDLDGDGLFLVDLASGEVRLIVSYRQLIAAHPYPYDLEGNYLWLNHAIFNRPHGRESDRVMVLLRYAPQMEPPQPWRTFMFTMRLDGSDLRCSLSDVYWRGMISHQIWGRTAREVLVDANWGGRGHEIVVFDEGRCPWQAQRISRGMGPAGHLNFSPDGRWLVADTYPDTEGVQRLALVEVATGAWVELGRFRHQVPGVQGDLRCDLHPRWSADGRTLTVDTIHTGERKIFLLELTRVVARGLAGAAEGGVLS